MVQARKEVGGAEAGTEAKLVLGQKILLFQVGHDPPVHHFFHDFGEDAQQGHRAIVLDGCPGPFLMDWDDVRRLPQGWLSSMLKAEENQLGERLRQLCCAVLQHSGWNSARPGRFGHIESLQVSSYCGWAESHLAEDSVAPPWKVRKIGLMKILFDTTFCRKMFSEATSLVHAGSVLVSFVIPNYWDGALTPITTSSFKG